MAISLSCAAKRGPSFSAECLLPSAVEARAGQRLPEILGFRTKFNPFLSSDRRSALARVLRLRHLTYEPPPTILKSSEVTALTGSKPSMALRTFLER
jgi:hypothetical protein